MKMNNIEVVMVVYAYDICHKFSNPWIYGVYIDHQEGFEIMEQMRESKDCGHLIWSNNLVELK
jgi:hypothetical protein